jgi:hypothetical protein
MRRTKAQLASLVVDLFEERRRRHSAPKTDASESVTAVHTEAKRWRESLEWALGVVDDWIDERSHCVGEEQAAIDTVAIAHARTG